MAKSKQPTALQIRKQQLVVEGLMYRARIVESKQAVKESPVVTWFDEDKLEQTTTVASSWVSTALRYRALFPVVLSGASLAARWVWRKPLLYSGIIVSALGLLLNKQSQKNDTE